MVIRIITGVIGIALAIFVIQSGGWIFGAAVFLLMLAGWHEFSDALRRRGDEPAYISGMTAVFIIWLFAWRGGAVSVLGAVTAVVLLLMSQAVFFHKSFSIHQSLYSIAGVMYVGLPFSHFLLLRFWDGGTLAAAYPGKTDIGCEWLWIALAGTWASDTFAYFSGMAFGKTKLCESISPKKTIEGFIGGVIGTALTVTVLGAVFGYPALTMLPLGGMIALAATTGDLAESALKRYCGVKDSGVLIPGHGGVLDRFDSAMFTVPFVYYFAVILYS